MNFECLFVTDTHIDKTVGRRDDRYVSDILDKLEQVGEYANDNAINVVLHGGDFFDRPRVDRAIEHEVSERMYNIATKYDLVWYILPGTHDVGKGDFSVEGKSLWSVGYVGKSERIKVVHPETRTVTLDEGMTVGFLHPFVELTPTPYNGCRILVIHQMITQEETPFTEKTTSQLGEVFSPLDKCVVLSGDCNPGFSPHKVNGVLFANPGACARTFRTADDEIRVPRFCRVAIHNDQCEVEYINFRYRKYPVVDEPEPTTVDVDTSALIEKLSRSDKLPSDWRGWLSKWDTNDRDAIELLSQYCEEVEDDDANA